MGCRYKTSSWHLKGFPNSSNIGSTVKKIGEKPTVILCTYIIYRRAGTPEKQRKQNSTSSNMVWIVIIYCYIV